MTRRLWLLAALLAVLAGCEKAAPTPEVASDVAKQSPDEAPPAQKEEQPPSGPQLITPAAASAALVNPSQLLTEEQLREGWISLFDGQTLFGWVANSETEWSVQDGAIVSKAGTPGLLLTTSPFHDYELKCDVWLEPGGNSGLFLRTVRHPKNPGEDCLEFNFCDSHASFATGSLVGRVAAQSKVNVEGDWHTAVVRLHGNKFTATIDGTVVLDAEDPAFATTGGGYIGLQQNGGKVQFRNVFLKPLGTESLFDGESLAGWRPVPGSKATMGVEEGTIHIAGGPGFLETERTFGDFVLQFEAKLNAADVNSGLFFRAEPGTEAAPSNGYEMQLQNTIADGDRTRPADYGDGFGTGAIFRRQRARYVNANDNEWFTVTLVANGNRFASWVNGLQVTDFTDERDPDPNPRKGRRDEAGHLSFQGHDPGTDASFRNVRISLLNSR